MLQVKRHPRNRTINSIVIETEEVAFEIELRGYITILKGQSCTNKTWFMSLLHEKYHNMAATSQPATGLSDIVMISDTNKDENAILREIKGYTKALILIDNASTVLANKQKLVQHISNDKNNQYIIVARGGLAIPTTLNYICDFNETIIDGKKKITNKFIEI